jgi:hypothetical protein
MTCGGFTPHTPTGDFRPLTLCVFGALRRNMKVFAHFLKKVAGVRGGTPINLPAEKYQISHMRLPYTRPVHLRQSPGFLID